MSDDLRAANPERWARARELLEIGKSLMELDEEANSLGTDSWAWLRQVEDFLAASSQVEPLLTMEQSENSIETILCSYCRFHQNSHFGGRVCPCSCHVSASGAEKETMPETLQLRTAGNAQATLESLKLEIRKRAFEEAAEHRPFEYNGSEWDWECDCGVHGHWTGDDSWKTHVLALESAPAVNEYPEKKP